jgi:hypothetical protein
VIYKLITIGEYSNKIIFGLGHDLQFLTILVCASILPFTITRPKVRSLSELLFSLICLSELKAVNRGLYAGPGKRFPVTY